MDSRLPADPRQRMVVAYLGHRLNHSELVALTQKGETSPTFEEDFSRLTERNSDQREVYTSEQLDDAWQTLGLKEQFAGLDETSVWSAEDRALHRRLSQPQHDPKTGDEALPPAALEPELASLLKENFDAWDRDGNTRLTADELDYLMTGGVMGEKLEIANDPQLAPVLTTLMRYDRLLGSARNDGDGITLADVEAWSSDAALKSTGTISLVNEAYAMYRTEAESAEVGQPLAQEQIAPELIQQGVAGSCVLLATLAGTSAEDLRSLVQDNEDGTHTVNFADGVSETISDPTLAERLYHSSGAGADRWPAIFEIATAQRVMSQGRRPEGLRSAIDGISPELAIPALSGKPVQMTSLDEVTLADAREVLADAVANGGPVICGSRARALSDFINVEELHNGIANGHCYSVLGYERDSDLVTLQNPWHKGEWAFAQDGADDGVFEMPLRDFYASFRWLGQGKAA